MFVFRKIWCALFFWNTRFEIRPFAILPAIHAFMLILFFHIKISEDFLYSHGYTLKLLELEPKINRPARKVEPNSTKLSRSKQ